MIGSNLGNVPRGMIAMTFAALFFAAASAITKYEVALYPVGEVMFLRSLTSFAVAAAFILPGSGLDVFRTTMPGAHAARGLSQSVSQTFTVLALGLMPLSSTIAINFSAPLWAALVSILWLRERPGPARLSFLFVGFGGVLIVSSPGLDTLQLGSLFALANAVMYGSVTVAVRRMSKTESWRTLMMWQLLVITVTHSFLLVFGVAMPSAFDLGLMVLSGLANAVAQYLWTRSLQLGPATAVSPFYYSMLPWGMLIGYFMWGDVPGSALIIGSLVVVGAGLLLLGYEGKKAKSNGNVATPAPWAKPDASVPRFTRAFTRLLAARSSQKLQHLAAGG
jgi:drug/metabolite transporter (DMT)-like permease